MKKRDLALTLVIISYFWLAATVVIGATNYPNYSHITQFMSELGAQGAPNAQLVNLAGYFVVEVVLLIGLRFAYTYMPKSTALKVGFAIFLAYPILIGVASLSPCDFECRPDDPSITHIVHVSSGLIAYLCAILGLAILTYYSPIGKKPDELKRLTYTCAPVLLIFLMNVTADNQYVGLAQRLMETGIYIWLVYLLVYWRNNSFSANHKSSTS
ncbi:DUF998 domain-containing protein [Maritalea sp.]|uniref:DUF998 domain-containing protein n=1 Tax=Maritalea sp. TaxID=2003361 RepID=UPI003EF1D107